MGMRALIVALSGPCVCAGSVFQASRHGSKAGVGHLFEGQDLEGVCMCMCIVCMCMYVCVISCTVMPHVSLA